jgi:hypothetical protein
MPAFMNTTMSGKNLFILSALIFLASSLDAQQITGIWEGKINNNKVEVKIIQKGDSLTGTSYYHSGGNNYRRYTIKGYFDPETNEVVWWDDQLIDDKKGRGFSQGHVPLVSRADFNCPGGAKMMLEGKSTKKENDKPGGNVYLEKSYNTPLFPDEWDFVIDNYTVGGNDPYIIDSIGLIAFTPTPKPPVIEKQEIPENTVSRTPVEVAVEPRPVMPAAPITIEEKFTIRKKVFTAEIPLEGDTLELRFFDNVQVDGDSITLFLNEKQIFTHIRLTEKPFIVKLAVNDLQDINELTMVAENLGAVPPNTAYMVAIVNGQRHEVNLSSTEETSGMIRLKKPERLKIDD